MGVAGGEIPWLGTVKLMVGGPNSYGTGDVPSSSFMALVIILAVVVLVPHATELVFRSWLAGAPELEAPITKDDPYEAS